MDMEELTRQNEIIKMMTETEYSPIYLTEEVNLEQYVKSPLSKIAALGMAFEPLTQAFQNVTNPGGSGIYKVIVPPGGHMANFRNSTDYLGSVLKPNNQVGGGQARMSPFLCNPATLFMAAALIAIDQKLDKIQEVQQEMLAFLEQKEKAKLRGNLNFLNDILNSYKHNWNNDKFKNNNHIKVLDIKRDSEQSILLYRDQIKRTLNKQSFVHSDKDVKEKLKALQSQFKEYQLSLHLYSFSSFLEVMLLENFESAYLDSVSSKIEDYAFQYRELYTECYAKFEKYSNSSVQSHVLKGLANVHKIAGEAVAKIPVVSKSQIDETLIATSGKLADFESRKTEQTVKQLISQQHSAVQQFIENINMIKKLYNQPMELLCDGNNIYLAK
jgi:hypothetical protein